jgi:neural Wiskott-Aldrich syndrome protein
MSEKRELKKSRNSKFLLKEENDLILRLVGEKCMSQCTAVAHVFSSQDPSQWSWVRKYSGVLCFVKDFEKRGYFFRMFCLVKECMVWEHKLNDSVHLFQILPHAVRFEGKVRRGKLLI